MVLSEPKKKFLPLFNALCWVAASNVCNCIWLGTNGVASAAFRGTPTNRLSSHGYWPLRPIMAFHFIVLRGPMTDFASGICLLEAEQHCCRSFSTTHPPHKLSDQIFLARTKIDVSRCKQSATDECNAPLGALAMSPYLMGMVIRGW